MAELAIGTISEDLLKRLKQSAQINNHELSVEALDCLERGLREREKTAQMLQRVRRLHASMPNVWLTDEIIADAKAERR